MLQIKTFKFSKNLFDVSVNITILNNINSYNCIDIYKLKIFTFMLLIKFKYIYIFFSKYIK